MLVDPKKLSDVIDKFGTNIIIVPHEDGRLRITLKEPPMGMKYWALQYLEYIEVLTPTALRNEIIDLIKNNLYGKDIM